MTNKHPIFRFVFLTTLCLTASLFSLASTIAAQEGQQQDVGSRQIFAEEFTKNRIKPPTNSSTTQGATAGSTSRSRTNASSASSRQRPRYKRVTPATSQAASTSAATHTSNVSTAASDIPLDAAKLGVTIWRLRPANTADKGARILVQENAKGTEWTPERVSAGTELRVNDRVRLTIESPRAGYLYVVDREQYADGSFGDPFLIFPTSRTRGGDNRAEPGKLIDIPAQEDNPNYFTLIPSPSRQDQTAEVLSVIVTTEPLENFEPSDRPIKLSRSQVEKWEKQWGTRVEQYELEGGAGRTWSKEEREAARAGVAGRYLTQEDPSPQTIYLVEGKNNKGLLVTVPLRYRR